MFHSLNAHRQFPTFQPRRLIASAYVTIGQSQGRTLLPLPPVSVAGPAEKIARDKERVRVLEASAQSWAAQIKAVLKADPEALLRAGENPGPAAEFDFWRGQATNLLSVQQQLQGDKVTHRPSNLALILAVVRGPGGCRQGNAVPPPRCSLGAMRASVPSWAHSLTLANHPLLTPVRLTATAPPLSLPNRPLALSHRQVRKVVRVLELSKSPAHAAFVRLTREVGAAAAEATDNARYLRALEKAFSRMHVRESGHSSSPSFPELPSTFRPVVHVVMLVWKHSRFYNTPARLSILVRAARPVPAAACALSLRWLLTRLCTARTSFVRVSRYSCVSHLFPLHVAACVGRRRCASCAMS